MNDERIPIREWGKDHWSLLAYIEVRVIDNNGSVDIRNLRCIAKKHPAFDHGHDASKYPTRLAHGKTRELYDDWDCIEDLIEEGLIRWEGTGICPIFEMTDEGSRVCGVLRAHKARGGNFASFGCRKTNEGRYLFRSAPAQLSGVRAAD